jgi:hypothetical protein
MLLVMLRKLLLIKWLQKTHKGGDTHMTPAQKQAFVKRMQSSRGGKSQSVSPARTPAINVPQGMKSSSKTATRVGRGSMNPGAC